MRRLGNNNVAMTEPDDKPGALSPVAEPFDAEIEARAAELRALIAATPAATSYGRPPGWLELRERRRQRYLLAAGGALIAAGALTFVLIMTGVSLLGVALFAPGVLICALAIGWRPFYSLYLPGLALAEQLYRAVEAQGDGRKGTHALMLALARLSSVDWKAASPGK